MSQLSRSGSSSILLVVLCVLLTVDILFRVFDGGPVEATRISGRETDAAITQLSGTYNQMAAANQALSAAINRLTSELARLELDKWAKAESELAKAQDRLAAAADSLAQRLAEQAVDSRGTLEDEGSGEDGSGE